MPKGEQRDSVDSKFLVPVSPADRVVAPIGLDPFVARELLPRFGRLPEFEQWIEKGFRLTTHDLTEGIFTIESPSTGSIDYALLKDKEMPIAVARRHKEYSPTDGALEVVGVAYWMQNFQYRYRVGYVEEKAGRCSVAVEYASVPHQGKAQTISLAHVNVLDSDDGVQRVSVVVPFEHAEDRVRAQAFGEISDSRFFALYLDGNDPSGWTLSYGAGEQPVPVRLKGRPYPIPSGGSLRVRRKKEEYLVFMYKYDKSGALRDSVEVPEPGVTDIPDLGRNALLEGKSWTTVNQNFPILFHSAL